jgi:hypothetical protein
VWKSALVVLASGCSLLMTSRPPDPVPTRGGIRCTETPVPVLVDVVLAAAATVAWGFFVDRLWSSPDGSMAPGAALIVIPIEFTASAAAALVPGGFGASAIYGYANTKHCSEAKAAMRSNALDPDAETPGATRGEQLAHDGELAAERGDCNVVRAIADQLRTMNNPAMLDRYLHNVGVAQCM